MNFVRGLLLCLVLACGLNLPVAEAKKAQHHKVKDLKITTLSTMLASRGIGEWGYSALVEADGKTILFDTGMRVDTVLNNAKDLRIDLSTVEDVLLSHNHGDHTGGLLTLRQELMKQNPKALSRVHVGKGIFAERANRKTNRMLELKKAMEATGAQFIVYDKATEWAPGMWITGPVERIHPERNWGGKGQIVTDKGLVEDIIAEDQSLVIDSDKGFVLVSGCGHAGIINTMEHIVSKIHPGKVHAAIGGFHLVSASDEHLKWTAEKMAGFGTGKIIGAHCTGINSLFALKDLMNLKRSDAVVGSIGDSFDLEAGITPSYIAR